MNDSQRCCGVVEYEDEKRRTTDFMGCSELYQLR